MTATDNSGQSGSRRSTTLNEGAGAGNLLTDTSRGMDIAEYIEAQKRKDATNGT